MSILFLMLLLFNNREQHDALIRRDAALRKVARLEAQLREAQNR